jgi:hypothetical protein
VGAEVGFDFDDTAGEVLRTVLVREPMEEHLAQQAGRYQLRGSLKEGTGYELAGWRFRNPPSRGSWFPAHPR